MSSDKPLSLWKQLARRAGKRYLSLRYRNFQPDSSPEKRVRVAGLRLQVLRGVFDPSMHFTSGVLARYLMRSGVVKAGTAVLDLGTGSGVAAIAAALAGARRVVATDINPAAVRSAQLNVKRYKLEDKVSIGEGDMFDPVAMERFDLVVCNPPYFRGEPESIAGRAYYAGPEFEWLQRFGGGLADHLTRGGSAIISIGDAADISLIRALLADCGWTCEQVARRDIIVETIYLFRLTHTAGGNSDGRQK